MLGIRSAITREGVLRKLVDAIVCCEPCCQVVTPFEHAIFWKLLLPRHVAIHGFAMASYTSSDIYIVKTPQSRLLIQKRS